VNPEEVQLKILYFRGQKNDASKFVRVLEPLHYLEKQGHKIYEIETAISSNTTEEVFQEMNMVLISNVDVTPNNFESFRRLAHYCKQTKKLIVYDFDDIYYEVPESNPHKKRTLTWDFILTVMAYANLLTVTGRELYVALRKFHQSISVLPNMLDFKKYKPRPQLSKIFRVGWAGGASHLQDIPLVFDAIRDLQKRYNFEFTIFGMFEDYHKLAELIQNKEISPDITQDPFEKDFIQFIRGLNGINYQIKSVLEYEQFPDELSRLDLDIGLCPIKDTLFNRCRSGLKFYQYAAVNTVTAASKIYPYSEEPVVLCENTTQSWKQQLELLITNKAFREEALKVQYDFVFGQRNYEKNIMVWERSYQIALAKMISES
jgi:glycosyltransferase involved in cell wall biosynthesis